MNYVWLGREKGEFKLQNFWLHKDIPRYTFIWTKNDYKWV